MKPNYVSALFVVVAAILFSPVPSLAVVYVDVIQPWIGKTVGSDVSLLVCARSDYEIASVTAEIEDHSLALTYVPPGTNGLYCWPGSGWGGTLNLSGLAEGSKSLKVTATDALGNTGINILSVTYDTPPVVNVVSPLADSVATPLIRVTASCSDVSSECKLRAHVCYASGVQSTELATGVNSIDQVVSLDDNNGKEVEICFEGTDSRNQTTSIRSSAKVKVEMSGRLHKIFEVSGDIWDYGADGRVLYLENGSDLKIADTSAGTVTKMTEQPESGYYARGFLRPNGAIYKGLSGKIIDVVDGISASWSGSDLKVAGNYALWSNYYQGNLYKRDLLSLTNELISAEVIGADITTNADVVYEGNCASRFEFTFYNCSLLKNSAGVSTTLDIVNNELSGTYGACIKTDGINTAYMPSYPYGESSSYRDLYFNDGTSSVLLEQNTGTSCDELQLNNGWAVFELKGTTQPQIWLRSPTGIAHQVTFFSTRSTIVALGPNGDMFFTNGNKLYYHSSTQGTIEISTALAKTVYVNSAWHAIIGNSIFTIDTDPSPHLTLVIKGTGEGSVHSVPGDISCISGSPCPAKAFPLKPSISLIPLASSTSYFTGWSSACSISGNNCNLAMNVDKLVLATFDAIDAVPKAKIGSTGYSTIQSAYDFTYSHYSYEPIKLLEGVVVENVICDKSVSATLAGGYNAAYSGVSTDTTISGSLVVRNGTVRVKRVNIY